MKKMKRSFRVLLLTLYLPGVTLRFTPGYYEKLRWSKNYSLKGNLIKARGGTPGIKTDGSRHSERVLHSCDINICPNRAITWKSHAIALSAFTTAKNVLA
jgi:hypothetical protein